MAGFGGAVKLKGESEYRRALKQITQNLKEVSSEMRAVSSAYDKGDNSTEAVKNKTEALTKVLDTQKKKLSTLQAEYKSMAAAMAEQSAKHAKLQSDYNSEKAKLEALGNTLGTTSKEYIDQKAKVTEMAQALDKSQKAQDANKTSMSNMRVAINRAQADVNKTSNEIKKLGEATEEAGEQAEDSSEGYTVLKGTLADLASQGIQAVAGKLKELVLDSSDAYAQFSAQTGVATGAMGKYKQAIDNVYKSNFGESLQDVAEKMGKVKEVTGTLDASKLEDLTKKAMTLDDTFGMDFTETLRGSQALMNHFGITGQQAFDLISAGAQNGLNYSDELGDNLSEYSGKFAEAGYSAKEYFQLLQNGSQGGSYNLDKVNDAINEVTTRLGDGTIKDSLNLFSSHTQKTFKAWEDGKATQKDVIESIVKDINGTKNQQDKLNMSAKAFGTMAEDGGTKFISNLTSVGKKYDDVNGKADKLAKTKYDTPAQAIQGIGRTLQTDLLQPLVNDMMPTLNKVANWVSSNLPGIIDNVKSVLNTVDKLSPLIVGVGVALGALKLASIVSQVGGLGTALLTAVKSTKAFELAQAALNLVMNANPFVLIVSAIAGLVAAFVVAYQKSETFRNIVNGAFAAVKSTVTSIVTALGSFISSAWNGMKNVTSTVFNAIKNVTITVWNGIKSGITNVVNGTKSVVTNVWNGIKSVTSTVWNAIKSTISGVVNGIKSTVSSVWNAIKSTTSSVWNGIKGVTSSVWNGIKSTISGVVHGVKSTVTSVWNAIKSTTSSVFNGIKGTASSVWNGIKSTISGVVNGIKSTVTSVWNGIKGATSSAWNAIKSAITGPINAAKNTISNVVNSIRNTVRGIFDGIRPKLNISLPHISVNGGKAPFGIGGKGSLPSFNVSWYAKGGVFDQGARLLTGVGEDGAEAIVPLERNTKWIKRVAEEMRATQSITATNQPQYNQTSNDLSFDSMVGAFKQALSEMKVEMDDEEMGKFVDKTVTRLVYN